MGDAIRRRYPECSYRLDGLHNHLDDFLGIFVYMEEIYDVNLNVNFQECYGQFFFSKSKWATLYLYKILMSVSCLRRHLLNVVFLYFS